VLIADPWAALAAAGFIYLAMIPLSVRSFRRLRLEAETLREDADHGRRESA
jgi:CDP-diacylglycerol---serine O-phosphatidyltransferase